MRPPMHDPILFRQPARIQDSHIVRRGDSLESIATKYNVTTSAIMKANNLSTEPINLNQMLTIPNERIVKDDYGFPVMVETHLLARVIEESTLVKDERGQDRQASYTIHLPPSVTPQLGDEIEVDGKIVTILKRKARKSFSGKKIFYWVTNCGE